MQSPSLPPLTAKEWTDPWWRLNHLYWILDKNGRPVLFKPNAEQEAFYRALWFRNDILKARQLGFSTLMALLALDQCTWVPNFTAAVIDITMPDAIKKLRKVEFAYKRLPELVKLASPVRSQAATEWMWANGSSLYCGVSARGGTTNLLHVSELGKIAARFPQKAREIITGAFESVAVDGMIVVESTAEGASGAFFEITDEAHKRQLENTPPSKLDFRLHFFPWYTSKEYTLDPTGQVIPEPLQRYFRELQAKQGITLTPGQMAWYAAKKRLLKGDMKREYPSTVAEAFEAHIQGAIYAEQMTYLREQGRITKVPLDVGLKVNTFWDFGASDQTAIWFHQYHKFQHRFFHYRGASNKGLKAWWLELEEFRREHGFQWGRHYLPHDADAVFQGEDVTNKASILHSHGMRGYVVVPRIADINTGINLTRDEMVRDVWIDKDGCAEGIKCLDAYQWKWHEPTSTYLNDPLHNWASHGSDAFRQWAQAREQAQQGDGGDKAIRNLKNRDRRR